MILILSGVRWAFSCFASLHETIQVSLAANVFLLGAGTLMFRALPKKGSFLSTLEWNLLLVCNFNNLERRLGQISANPASTSQRVAR